MPWFKTLLVPFIFIFASIVASAATPEPAVQGLCHRILSGIQGFTSAPSQPLDRLQLQTISAKWKIADNSLNLLKSAVVESLASLAVASPEDAQAARRRQLGINAFVAEVQENLINGAPQVDFSPEQLLQGRRIGRIQVLDITFMAYEMEGQLYLEVQNLSSPALVTTLSQEVFHEAPAFQEADVAFNLDPQVDLEQLISMVDLLRRNQLFNQPGKKPDVQAMIEYLVAHSRPLAPGVRTAKRAMDITVAGLGILATAPLYPIIAAAIFLDSPGPIFFRQERVGPDLRAPREIDQATGQPALRTVPFGMWKFRTMRPDAERNGAAITAAGDSRVTRVGRLLRSTRLDEIPQFWNVLTGEMSVVGPRPEREKFIDELNRVIPHFRERLRDLPPGITGLAQVTLDYLGRHPEDLDGSDTLTPEQMLAKSFALKLLHDLIYHEAVSQGFWRFVQMDFTVMWRTPAVMLGGLGRRALGR